MILRKLLATIFITISLSTFANIHFRNIGKSEGLSQLSVMSICQDELGRMWFGTLEGINCYDGERVTAFRTSDKYPFLGNQTFNIVCDMQGSLIFTSDSTMFHYDIYTEKFTMLREKNVRTLYSRNNEIWMALKDSIYQWDPSGKQFRFALSHPLLKSIRSLCIDANDRLWVATTKGLFRFDHVDNPGTPASFLPGVDVLSLYSDSKKNMWVAAFRNGMYRITDEVLSDYTPRINNIVISNDIRSFTEDDDGNLWIATFNGLIKLDEQGHSTNYQKDNLPGSLKHSSIFPLYKDQQGNIWLGTYYAGAYYFEPNANQLTHYVENADRDDCLSFFFVGKMVEDKRGDVWICTEGGGLNKLDRKTGKFTHYLADGKPNSVPFNHLKSIVYDQKHDRLYIGTHTRGLFYMDITTGKVTPDKNIGRTGSIIMHMELFDEDELFFVANNGIFIMNTNTQQIIDMIPVRGVHTFTIDSMNLIWIALSNGLLRINIENPEDRVFYKYGEKGLGKFPVSVILEKDSKLFFGTNGSGLFSYNAEQDDFYRYTAADGWNQSNNCYEMALSSQHDLIVLQENGLSFFNPENKITREISLESLNTNEGCGVLVCRDGEVFAGTTTGMVSFMEDNLFAAPAPYNLYFSSLSVNNQLIRCGDNGILDKAFPFVDEINLKYNQDNIIITFASSNYIDNLQHTEYEYRLEGLSDLWITSVDKRIVYTNLPSGNYTLVVREKKHEGNTGQSIRMQIAVHPPWYATWLAYLCYFMLVSGIVFYFIRNRRIKMQLQYSLEKEKREKEKNEEITQAKLQFFSNISHEFRTPLTLIISQLEMLLQYKGLSPYLHNRLIRIYRNTFQLRELISELLDFRKLDQGGMRLNVGRTNIVSFLQGIYREFNEQALLKNIVFQFESPADDLWCWIDTKQMKKVFSNLLSNAFKFTPDGGKITITVEETGTGILVKIIDTGQGISQKALPHIFERFYQADSSVSQINGTGIGLALAKRLVDLHHGEITVHSAPGYGSIFSVSLPTTNSFTPEDTYVSMADAGEQPQKDVTEPFILPEAIEEDPQDYMLPTEEWDKPSILVVEDNEEILQILTDLLSPLYKVSIALNGKDGLEKALQDHPDLILSDVLMPVMSGMEMCQKIKNHFDLCHTPVILLTALTNEDKNIEGLQCGADDYIGKPFSNKLLISKIANTLRNRNLLINKYRQLPESTQVTDKNMHELALNAMDQKFLVRLNEIIEKHISDPEFDINRMAREIGVSRSSLYNKLKALSCMTPNEFMIKFKLRRATEMLKNNPELQITEIAYQLGFNSLRYFRYCFKAEYNLTPQEYRNKE